MKKIINAPEAFVDETIESLLVAHPDHFSVVGGDQRVLVRGAEKSGKVGIVTGGGSGHLPLFLGYVGPGLCSAVAIGNVFSSPSAEQMFAAIQAADEGAGVLCLYGNYGGDVLNFDLACDFADVEDIATATVLGIDDVLSAPRDRADSRRGVAGLVLAYKVAGAAAAEGRSLDEVVAVTRRAVSEMGTAGVGLSPTILPAAGQPTFTLPDGEMEIGIGIHGEPGQHRGPLESADAIAQRLFDAVQGDLGLTSGDRIAVLVNGLGATPLEELYVVYRKVAQLCADAGIAIERRYIGEYATSLEMAGASLSLLRVDDELLGLLDAPSSSPLVRF